MAIKLDIECDDCSSTLNDTDACYCETCFENLEKQIKELEEQVAELENDLAEAE